MPGVIEGGVGYAFYLLIQGPKMQVRWYERFSTHTFTLTAKEASKLVQIRGLSELLHYPSKSSPPLA